MVCVRIRKVSIFKLVDKSHSIVESDGKGGVVAKNIRKHRFGNRALRFHGEVLVHHVAEIGARRKFIRVFILVIKHVVVVEGASEVVEVTNRIILDETAAPIERRAQRELRK